MRDYMPSYEGAQNFSTFRITKVVKILLIANVAVFLLQVLWDRSSSPYQVGPLTQIFGLWRERVLGGWIWQLGTYMFLHSQVMISHILFNSLTLLFMGPETERAMGDRHFTIMYFLSGVLGGLSWTLLGERGASCIGASGAISGVIGAFAALYPNRPITLLLFFVLPIRLRAWVLAVGLFSLQFVLLISPSRSPIAYGVHIAGGITGCIYALLVFRPHAVPWLTGWAGRLKRGTGRARSIRPRAVPDDSIDDILDKIAREGMGYLTRRERKRLEDASRRRKGRG